jgi:hypothetical protein
MIAGLIAALAAAMSLQVAAPADPRSVAADRVQQLTRDTNWTLSTTILVDFPTFHPQGMARIGETFFVSSVEIKVRTQRFEKPIDGIDRDTGEGVGHLFKIDAAGRLIADLKLGEGPMYHPGGIDYDGRHIWIPVAEYRPNSRTIIYKVDPESLKAVEVLRVPDHIGAIVHDTDGNALHGASWGSRRFYRWPLDAQGRPTADASAGAKPRSNPSHYIDYQDCKYAGDVRMLCTGLSELRRTSDGQSLRLGGIELVDLRDGRPIHQVPVLLWTKSGLPLTQNPVWIEPSPSGLRAYFMPEDERSTIYVYEVSSQ